MNVKRFARHSLDLIFREKTGGRSLYYPNQYARRCEKVVSSGQDVNQDRFYSTPLFG